VAWLRALLIGVGSVAISCAGPLPARPPALTDSASIAPEYREAAAAVAAYLVQKGENPKEFLVNVSETRNNTQLEFHLSHESAFEPRYRNVDGNPGGKNRTVYYDKRARAVTQMLFWQ